MTPDQIRDLQPADAEAIREILERSGRDHGLPNWPRLEIEATLREHAGVGLWDNKGLAAFILFQRLPGAREVLHLATHPRVRRQGKMRALCEWLLASRGVGEELWLEVHERNLPARRLYEALGFENVGARPKYYADGGTAVLYNRR